MIDQPQDIALIRRILRDPQEGDTIRNETANLLTRSEVPQLADDLIRVLEHPTERARFRSFAMQHLGVLWLQRGAKPDDPIRARLIAGLDDRHVPVRREALLPLTRGQDTIVPARIAAILGPDGDAAQWDLACRLVADLELADHLPAVRALLTEADETIRCAALDAIARMGDTASRAEAERAAQDANPRIAAAGRRALSALTEAKP
ncbi:MAG: hypothetical protein ACOCVS_00770 [Planctomycetota bacterium]